MRLRPPARPNLALLDRVLSTPSRARVNTEEKYRPGGRDERAGKTLEGVDPTMPIRRTFEENLVPCLSPEAALRSDVMREDRCYLEPVDIVLRKHEIAVTAARRLLRPARATAASGRSCRPSLRASRYLP